MDNVSAHKLRQLNREEAKKSIKRDAKKLIEEYINQNSMQPPCEVQHHYEAINQLLEENFDTAQNFQLARRGFLERLQAAAQPIHAEISNQQETLTLAYQTGVAFERDDDLETVKAAFEAALARQEAREIMQGTTLVGPHRDDIKFIVNENDVAVFGSSRQVVLISVVLSSPITKALTQSIFVSVGVSPCKIHTCVP